MKKILLVLVIGAFAACNDSAKGTENVIDSTADATVDSIQEKSDSLSSAIDSTKDVKVDSVKASADTLKK